MCAPRAGRSVTVQRRHESCIDGVNEDLQSPNIPCDSNWQIQITQHDVCCNSAACFAAHSCGGALDCKSPSSQHSRSRARRSVVAKGIEKTATTTLTHGEGRGRRRRRRKMILNKCGSIRVSEFDGLDEAPTQPLVGSGNATEPAHARPRASSTSRGKTVPLEKTPHAATYAWQFQVRNCLVLEFGAATDLPMLPTQEVQNPRHLATPRRLWLRLAVMDPHEPRLTAAPCPTPLQDATNSRPNLPRKSADCCGMRPGDQGLPKTMAVTLLPVLFCQPQLSQQPPQSCVVPLCERMHQFWTEHSQEVIGATSCTMQQQSPRRLGVSQQRNSRQEHIMTTFRLAQIPHCPKGSPALLVNPNLSTFGL